jgi:beta-phosphoglucomutase
VPRVVAVLFDLDGVLIDTTEWHYEALNRALALFGFTISRYEHLSTYNGLPTRKKLEMLSVEKGLPKGLHNLINRLKQVYTREGILLKCRPVFEKEYVISRLKQDGYRLAVCSSAVRESVELMLRQSGLYEYFEFLISNEDVTKAKPNPEIYTRAIDRIGCRPQEVVIVEDSPHGVESARSVGGNVCQVSGFTEVEYFWAKRFIDQIERREL